jgi:hypothetical protein
MIRHSEVIAVKKPYQKPTVIHTEKLEARAVICAKATDATCAAPLSS